MDLQFIVTLVTIYLIVDRVLNSTLSNNSNNMLEVILNMQKQFIEIGQTQNKIASEKGVTFEETKEILHTMTDEYIDTIYSMENDRLFLIKDKEFPTSSDGVYVLPDKARQEDQIQRLKTSVQRYASKTFMDRLRIFYTDEYIFEYITKMVEEKYYVRLNISEENARIFRKTCSENLEKLRKEQDMQRKKEIVERNKKLNSILDKLSYTKYLPENTEEVDDIDRVEGTDTHKLLRGRYLLNKKYYDQIASTIKHENDIFTGIDNYTRPDDKAIGYLAKEFNWDSIAPDPYTIEDEKYNVSEICMRYGINPVTSGLFGEHDSPAKITETFKGKSYDMTDRRLNNVFYLEETYTQMYTNINEASISEDISAIFV